MAPPATPRRIVLSNLPLDSTAEAADTEPGVEVFTEELQTEELFNGLLRRTPVGTVPTVPASNDGLRLPSIGTVPGTGIVLPGGINIYFLDLAPGSETPMHRTPSLDFVAVNEGTPTLVTPKGSFRTENEKGTLDDVCEKTLRPGDVAVQRGAMHAWINRSDSWVRMMGVVVSAKPSEIEIGDKVKTLGERWLQ
ncbi:uncharacterized protein CTRU02_204420 [Colletotrichum truncatum]|uniref:Uncharacterized protein n=1 Tax=Colletotrichum truncatum TaxID=5467 RepID=A0ACC3ZC17_COLTU|nr:uncharacterized protein CTRU02_14401 [Colletotrichum truncatum]KAF6782214.1 hypothetical protein CTRU02_14401 [Colletotrichum truncatum]